MKKLEVGMLVVCVKAESPKYNFLVGCVGTIEAPITGIMGFLTGHDWIVDFPQFRHVPCPCCGKSHEGQYGMKSNELKPLEDPDKDEEKPRVEELDKPEFGFVA